MRKFFSDLILSVPSIPIIVCLVLFCIDANLYTVLGLVVVTLSDTIHYAVTIVDEIFEKKYQLVAYHHIDERLSSLEDDHKKVIALAEETKKHISAQSVASGFRVK